MSDHSQKKPFGIMDFYLLTGDVIGKHARTLIMIILPVLCGLGLMMVLYLTLVHLHVIPYFAAVDRSALKEVFFTWDFW